MRDAYRQKGWAFVDAETIIQCKREGWSKKMESVRPEGCRAVGYLEVNKVRDYEDWMGLEETVRAVVGLQYPVFAFPFL